MTEKLPHEGVYVRIGVSETAGVGVFAIRAIPAGTSVFANDDRPIMWIDATAVDAHSPDSSERRFYEDFAVRRGDKLGCPTNFNLLTVGWYLNEPAVGAQPNIEVLDDLSMVAARDIDEGEELTVRYDTFSDAD